MGYCIIALFISILGINLNQKLDKIWYELHCLNQMFHKPTNKLTFSKDGKSVTLTIVGIDENEDE